MRLIDKTDAAGDWLQAITREVTTFGLQRRREHPMEVINAVISEVYQMPVLREGHEDIRTEKKNNRFHATSSFR